MIEDENEDGAFDDVQKRFPVFIPEICFTTFTCKHAGVEYTTDPRPQVDTRQTRRFIRQNNSARVWTQKVCNITWLSPPTPL